MLIHELLQGVTHKAAHYDKTLEITKVAIDSRQVVPGALFVCLNGLTANGHNYAQQAIQCGAAAIVAQEDIGNASVPVISVASTRQALAYIAANFYHNPAHKLRLVGITGTNGKTTTTCFIEEMLRNLGRKTGLIGTIGAKIGSLQLDIPFATSTTPDPLELNHIFATMLNHGVQDVVMEVSSHALALHKMLGLVFDVGVFTNLTQDHLDFHGTMENYSHAKAQLFAQSRFAVVNNDDKYTPVMLRALGKNPYATYSINAPSNLQASALDFTHAGTNFSAAGVTYNMQVAGEFNVYNMLAAISTVQHLLPQQETELKAVVEGIAGVPGRIQAVPNSIGAHILVDYAHTPDGLENIISAVRKFATGRVITIFGCGGNRDTTKRPAMGLIAGKLSDYCIITSDNPRNEDPLAIIAHVEEGIRNTNCEYSICANRKDAIVMGIGLLQAGDALIIAGKGHEDYQEINGEKHAFSDYGVAATAILEAEHEPNN